MSKNPSNSQEQSQETTSSKSTRTQKTASKGRATPKRKDAQERNLRPLVPKDRKAQKKADKARRRAQEDAEYEAMRTGDINHMPKAERLPWRVYIRDYVDARVNLGEFFIPVAFALLLLSMVVTAVYPALSMPILLLLYVYLFAVIIDVAIMWRKLKKIVVDKFGERAIAKGMRTGTYAWSRAIQFRRWRMPKPRYPKRGNWPDGAKPEKDSKKK